MARLKTREQLEQERIDEQRYALGNVILDTQKLLLIYARQSSSKQYVSNIYSAMEQRDGLLEKASTLGWTRDEQWILYVENQLAKKTQVSGSLRIDQRPGLQALTEVIQEGKASAVLVVGVDRITRDEDLITPTQFANLCKRYHVLIITDDYTYDFNNPSRNDIGQFMNEAIASKEYVRKQIKGKMLKNRTRKANMGLVANGKTPIGLMLDESRDNLLPSPHAERVDWLYARFRALDANLAALLHEVINMARRGEPLFPDVPGWTPDHIHLKRMPSGWTLSTRTGLKYVLSNPMYAGHLVFNGRIVKYNAHPAIVEADNWQYAFNHLARVDLDGQPIDRPNRAVRYTQHLTNSDSGALLFGTRESGKLVIDSVNGAHVYIQMPGEVYTIRQLHGLSATGYETSISIKELDMILEARLLRLLNASERAEQHANYDASPVQAMDKLKQTVQPLSQTGVQDDLTLTNQELASVQRALQFQDSMSDERLEETLKKEKRLIKRRAELEQVQAHGEQLAREQEQAKEDIETAASKWAKWSIEKRRSFIRMVTDSITLEEIASGWLRLVIVWSPIMGFISPMTSSTRAVFTAYIWRQSGTSWTDEEKDVIRQHYTTTPRSELLRLLPTRSWTAIVKRAIRLKVKRLVPHNHGGNDVLDIPTDTSITDLYMFKEFGLSRERVQWFREFVHDQISNGDAQLGC
jgi:DNA invertase Pin-like site-specific DNA recombinase